MYAGICSHCKTHLRVVQKLAAIWVNQKGSYHLRIPSALSAEYWEKLREV